MKDFYYKKRFGQNFLRDNSIPIKMISYLDVTPKDLIIEIGPGKGILTKELKKLNCHLVCFEIDEETKPFLEPLIDDKTEIIYGDFLHTDLSKYNEYQNIFIAANIPYNITTPIIEKIIKSNMNIKKMLLMVQKEVAERFSAHPNCKAYGALTVYISYYYETRMLFDVKRNNFYPIPDVDSAVIEFTKNEKKYDVNEEELFKLVKLSFVHKRKNIRNNLLDYDQRRLNEILSKYGKDINSRAEELPLEAFIDLTNNK